MIGSLSFNEPLSPMILSGGVVVRLTPDINRRPPKTVSPVTTDRTRLRPRSCCRHSYNNVVER